MKTSDLRFDYTPEELKSTTRSALSTVQKEVDQLAKTTPPNNFKDSFLKFEKILNVFDDQISTFHLLKETSTSVDLQNAAAEVADEISGFYAKLFTRVDLYQFFEKTDLKSEKLDFEDQKLVDETLRAFRKSGASLPEEKRAHVTKLKEELLKLENQFSVNLAKANDTVELTLAELEGVPESILQNLKKAENGNYLFTLLDSNSFLSILENSKHENTRKKILVAHDQVAVKDNLPLLEKAITLRNEIAQILGFKTHADYVLDSKMARNSQRVFEFLGDLQPKLKIKLKEDIQKLLELKKKDDPSTEKLEIWDWRYYANQYKKEHFTIDKEKIRQYFPVEHVISEVFRVYQTLLGVKFTETNPQKGKTWAEGLSLYHVTDAKTNAGIGYFYFDLYPRENKYKHFAAFTILQERTDENGRREPVSAIVGNFPKATKDTPALLSHSDVETFFHEFGHIMHQVLTTAKYSSLAGTSVRGDYVEAPSQMLENWVWNKASLKKISKHYKTGEPLPDDLIDKMIVAKHAQDGLQWSRQLFFALVDMKFHSLGKNLDTSKIWQEQTKETMLMEMPENTAPQATFGHLMGGYDAGYYGYLWSKVFAEDMFTVFEKHGLENPEPGLRYRKWILEPGGTKEPDVLIENFLGRKPSFDAFYKSLGLK